MSLTWPPGLETYSFVGHGLTGWISGRRHARTGTGQSSSRFLRGVAQPLLAATPCPTEESGRGRQFTSHSFTARPVGTSFDLELERSSRFCFFPGPRRLCAFGKQDPTSFPTPAGLRSGRALPFVATVHTFVVIVGGAKIAFSRNTAKENCGDGGGCG